MTAQLLAGTQWQARIFSDGWIRGGGEDIAVIEPATGSELVRVGSATAEDVDRAAARAVRAQRGWASRPYTERARVLRRAAALFDQHQDEIGNWLVRESGAVRPFASLQTLVGGVSECEEAAALASAPYGELLRTAQPRLSLARRVPVGVVGVITPFNGPLILAIRALAPALALGNAVLLKPDPRTPVSGGVIFARIFEEAGLPEGLLHVLPGGPEVGAALVDDPRVPVIAFTGSTRAGRAIATAAAARLKRVHLELGGNSALIVCADVDVERAASVGAFGTFNHAGQICMASGRHLVDSRIASEYTAALARHASELSVGNPAGGNVAIGPIIDRHQLEHVDAIVRDSVSAGASIAAGGTYEGLFYRPTVLAHVPTSARAYTEEIFGPVAPVVPFTDLDHAVQLAADSAYGLALGILTRDVMAGLELAGRIPAGMVHVNDQTVNDDPTSPFGGVGDSGTGSRHGGVAANLDAFTEQQWVTLRRDLPTYPY